MPGLILCSTAILEVVRKHDIKAIDMKMLKNSEQISPGAYIWATKGGEAVCNYCAIEIQSISRSSHFWM